LPLYRRHNDIGTSATTRLRRSRKPTGNLHASSHHDISKGSCTGACGAYSTSVTTAQDQMEQLLMPLMAALPITIGATSRSFHGPSSAYRQISACAAAITRVSTALIEITVAIGTSVIRTVQPVWTTNHAAIRAAARTATACHTAVFAIGITAAGDGIGRQHTQPE